MIRKRGFTLIQCLLLLSLTMILGGATFRMTTHGTRHTVHHHWGRTAEALADGALELALAELENGGAETSLDAVLSTGVASAQILPGSEENVYRVLFQGMVDPEGNVLASRTYAAAVLRDSSGQVEVLSIRRL